MIAFPKHFPAVGVRSMTTGGGSDRTELAGDRTDLAEDRTLLANERTFSGWARTSMASIGIAIGFNALFKPVEPTWVAKAIATLFLLLAIFLIMAAERRARAVQTRLTAHEIVASSMLTFRVMSAAVTLGACALIAALWWLT